MSITHVLVLPSMKAGARSKLIRALHSTGGAYRVLKHTADCLHYGPSDAYARQEVCQWVMNPLSGMVRSQSMQEMEHRLHLEGIASQLSSAPDVRGFYRRYLVQVYHLQVLQVIPWNGEDAFSGMALSHSNVCPASGSPLWKRLSRVAIRSIYALGLDYGEVLLRTDKDGQSIVERVTDGAEWRIPSWESQMAEAMTQQLQQLNHWQAEAPVPLIGMDPEFLLYDPDNGKVVPASRFLNVQGIAGCDVLRYRGRRVLPLAELRPKPGSEPREVVLHLLSAFRTARAAISDERLVWQAGGMPQRGFPLGGHLHFSGIPLSGELLRVLDNYLALPVALLEDERSSRRRPRYGALGDFRLQDYGGFEYRTLPSFLISPMVTKGIVALARIITEGYRELDRRPLDRIEVREAFYKGAKPVLAQEWPYLASDLRKLALYKRYQSYIDPLFDAISSGRIWDESADIRSVWRL